MARCRTGSPEKRLPYGNAKGKWDQHAPAVCCAGIPKLLPGNLDFPVFTLGFAMVRFCEEAGRVTPWRKLVQIATRTTAYNLRLRRAALRKGCAFPLPPLSYNLFSAAGRLSLPAAAKENVSGISAGKAAPFRTARGEAPRASANSDRPAPWHAHTNSQRLVTITETPDPRPKNQIAFRVVIRLRPRVGVQVQNSRMKTRKPLFPHAYACKPGSR